MEKDEEQYKMNPISRFSNRVDTYANTSIYKSEEGAANVIFEPIICAGGGACVGESTESISLRFSGEIQIGRRTIALATVMTLPRKTLAYFLGEKLYRPDLLIYKEGVYSGHIGRVLDSGFDQLLGTTISTNKSLNKSLKGRIKYVSGKSQFTGVSARYVLRTGDEVLGRDSDIVRVRSNYNLVNQLEEIEVELGGQTNSSKGKQTFWKANFFSLNQERPAQLVVFVNEGNEVVTLLIRQVQNFKNFREFEIQLLPHNAD